MNTERAHLIRRGVRLARMHMKERIMLMSSNPMLAVDVMDSVDVRWVRRVLASHRLTRKAYDRTYGPVNEALMAQRMSDRGDMPRRWPYRDRELDAAMSLAKSVVGDVIVDDTKVTTESIHSTKLKADLIHGSKVKAGPFSYSSTEGCQMSDIPTKAREVVKNRQGGRCAACGMKANDIHHRKRRRDGGHALSNLVHLCRDDHKTFHANPELARTLGYIVAVSDDPAEVPLLTYQGWAKYDDEGWTHFESTSEEEE